jgi:hypothetical protein
VRVGEWVENAQPEHGKEQHRVDEIHRTTTDTDFTDLTIATPDGPKTITSTSNHPYYDSATHSWTDAGDIPVGHLLQSPSGSEASVLAVRSYTKPQVTYDLTIDTVHTYFVLAGNTPVLVHNAGSDRFDQLNSPGYSNYLLVDRNGTVYYSGMFGPGSTPASVQYRHSTKNPGRYMPDQGDTMRVLPGTRTYGESRLLEQRLSQQYGTYIGRDGKNYRGNRQNPLDSKKLAEYEAYEAKIGGCS